MNLVDRYKNYPCYYLHIPYSNQNSKLIYQWFNSSQDTFYRIMRDNASIKYTESAQEVKKLYPNNVIFTTISNPYRRVFDSFINNRKKMSINSLSEYVNIIEGSLQGQTYYLNDDIDFVIKNETAHNDFKNMVMYLGLKNKIEFINFNTNLNIKKIFDQNSITKIQKIFSHDFELFYPDI